MKKIICLIVILCIVLIGCQNTPEKSSVVSKAEGLSEDVIAVPLKDGEKRAIDVPEHWQLNEKKSNGRVTISADLEIGKMQIGNLPVIEMSNHELSQEELEKLVSYFTKGLDLYVPEIYSKDFYKSVIDRIANKEGAYSNTFMWPAYQKLEATLKKAVELAPDIVPEAEKAEIKFQKKRENPALNALQNRTDIKREEQNTNAEDYFSVDVGKERMAYIEAERYNQKLENSSSFSWLEGAGSIGTEEIIHILSMHEYSSDSGLDPSGYTAKIEELLSKYEACLDQQTAVNEAEVKKLAEQVLKDLDIKNMKLSSSEKILWFPKGAYPVKDYPGFGEDYVWQGDLTKAEVGYQYIFSPYIEGIPAKQEYGIVPEKTMESYAPLFPVEKITITVTQDGIKGFHWTGISEERARITDNTKLLSFDAIQDQLLDQIFYWYTQLGQPENDPTQFEFKVTGAQLEYTYIPAFGEPKDAWLVPAWVFTVTQTSEGLEQPGYNSFVLNALDGGIIGNAV